MITITAHNNSLPLIMLALEEEMKLPVVGNEGPFGIILCPSRELARQTFDVVDYFCQVCYAMPLLTLSL
jgi:superfamily II DNA/RNA helicase